MKLPYPVADPPFAETILEKITNDWHILCKPDGTPLMSFHNHQGIRKRDGANTTFFWRRNDKTLYFRQPASNFRRR